MVKLKASTSDRIRDLPLTKLIVLCFTVFVCVLVVVDLVSSHELSDNAADLVKWLGSSIVLGYFAKSAYEHRVNVGKEAMKHEIGRTKDSE